MNAINDRLVFEYPSSDVEVFSDSTNVTLRFIGDGGSSQGYATYTVPFVVGAIDNVCNRLEQMLIDSTASDALLSPHTLVFSTERDKQMLTMVVEIGALSGKCGVFVISDKNTKFELFSQPTLGICVRLLQEVKRLVM